MGLHRIFSTMSFTFNSCIFSLWRQCVLDNEMGESDFCEEAVDIVDHSQEVFLEAFSIVVDNSQEVFLDSTSGIVV